ncbi:MAG TPA: hypothetical protein VM008_18275 [Phycisphaerae bacterium]|nr:hypothetical protein [Phycisphaerae bacterium]
MAKLHPPLNVRITFAALIIATAAATPAHAFGLKGHGRAVASVNPGSNALDLRQDTGWQSAGPVFMDLDANTAGDGGTVESDMHSVSNYGSLQASGFGHATNSNQTGDFAWASSYIGGEPNAWYKDQIEILSNSLPYGSPVTIQFSLAFTGFTNVTAATTATHATLSSEFDAGSVTLTVGTSTTSTPYETFETATLNTFVGASIPIQGRLWIDADADANLLNPIVTSTFNFAGSATTSIQILSAGVAASPSASLSPADATLPAAYFIADSGATYAPEPATLSLTLALPPLLIRRRKR